jgi:hypothetical protein
MIRYFKAMQCLRATAVYLAAFALSVSCAEESTQFQEASLASTENAIVLTSSKTESRSQAEAECGSLLDGGFSLGIDIVLPSPQQPDLSLAPKYMLKVQRINVEGGSSIVAKMETRTERDSTTTTFLTEAQVVAVCNIIQSNWADLSEAALDLELSQSCRVDVAAEATGYFVDLRSKPKSMHVLRWGLPLLAETCDSSTAHTALYEGIEAFQREITR